MFKHRVRRTLCGAIAAALAAGALAGPALADSSAPAASGDTSSPSLVVRKAGEKPVEYVTLSRGQLATGNIIAIL